MTTNIEEERTRVGEIFSDRYELERATARTEAGVVFQAKDRELGRDVAVELASSIEEPKAQRKWLRDAMIAQQLVGEHVLRVLDVGESRGVPFVVREISTRTLAEELDARGVVPIAQAVGWTLDACEAIAEAHAHGIAHGDLRIDNIHLVGSGPEPKVKVAWTSAAKAERAAREDVARDVAGLGAMLRILSTGRPTDDAADGAPTLPNGLAHAVARSLAEEPEGGFHNISELARALAPFAPPGHPGARNIAKILSRAGIVSGAVPPSDLPASKRGTDRASFTDEWFRRAPVGPHGPPSRHARAGALVSIGLVAMVLAGTWLLWDQGKLPQWTGAAPAVEAVDTTELTSETISIDNHALDVANAAATDPAMNPTPGVTEPPAPAEVERRAPPAAAESVDELDESEPVRESAPVQQAPAPSPSPLPSPSEEGPGY